MLLARIVGNVTATRKAEHLGGVKYLLARPYTQPDAAPNSGLIIAADMLGAGPGENSNSAAVVFNPQSLADAHMRVSPPLTAIPSQRRQSTPGPDDPFSRLDWCGRRGTSHTPRGSTHHTRSRGPVHSFSTNTRLCAHATSRAPA